MNIEKFISDSHLGHSGKDVTGGGGGSPGLCRFPPFPLHDAFVPDHSSPLNES